MYDYGYAHRQMLINNVSPFKRGEPILDKVGFVARYLGALIVGGNKVKV
jgi:hypothetical protein